MSKTTSLLKQMTEETYLCRNEHSFHDSGRFGQNVKPTPPMQIVVNFKNGGTRIHLPPVSPEYSTLNNA